MEVSMQNLVFFAAISLTVITAPVARSEVVRAMPSLRANSSNLNGPTAVLDTSPPNGAVPTSLSAATNHFFIKNAEGGMQRITAKKPNDPEQTLLVRGHLKEIRAQIQNRSSSDIPRGGQGNLPGPAAGRPGAYEIGYSEIPGGAELTYIAKDATVVASLHASFDAQLTDHLTDSTADHVRKHERLTSR